MREELLNSCIEEALFNTWEYIGNEDFGLTEFARYSEFIFEFSNKLIEAFKDAELFEKSPDAYCKLMEKRERQQKQKNEDFEIIFSNKSKSKPKSKQKKKIQKKKNKKHN